MKIIAIDTSCDETAAAVVENRKILSNVVWSQASLHSKWGGILPSLAQREHKRRIGWIIDKAISQARIRKEELDYVAVAFGPGLAVALQIGIKHAQLISQELGIPLVPINHVEGHVLSPLAESPKSKSSNLKINFPALSLVVSGGTTQLIIVNKIGNYEILAETKDDALGEALDKAARMLGFGYPGGAILEKIAKEGCPNTYPLPLPMAGREKEGYYSYSGLKTAMWRLVEKEKPLNKQKIQDLAAGFQDKAFEHIIKVASWIVDQQKERGIKNFLVGGGVAANVELRKRVRKLAKEKGLKTHFPYSKRLYTDNAAMIGVTAYFHALEGHFIKPFSVDTLDRIPRARVDQPFPF